MKAEFIWGLSIGNAHEGGTPTTHLLTSAMRHALQPDVAARAQSIAAAVRLITAGLQNAVQDPKSRFKNRT